MKQEDKELLLKDLCARLPYKPIVHINNCGIWNLRGIDHDNTAELRDRVIVWYGENHPTSKNSFPIIDCKPYLFPLSSMTEEQKSYLHFNTKFGFDSCNDLTVKIDEDDTYFYTDTYDYISLIDWLNKNHFDYRGLIEKGLAIDATNLNIY